MYIDGKGSFAQQFLKKTTKYQKLFTTMRVPSAGDIQQI
jgi:hypothetical protein